MSHYQLSEAQYHRIEQVRGINQVMLDLACAGSGNDLVQIDTDSIAGLLSVLNELLPSQKEMDYIGGS